MAMAATTDETAAPVEQDEEPVGVPEAIATSILSLVEGFDMAERIPREGMIRTWKKADNYWRHRQYLWWDEFGHEYKTLEEATYLRTDLEIDPATYAKVINIYKAHGEVIISALSNSIPSVRFSPDDADSSEDLSTARNYTRISELIQKQNKDLLIWMKALFILYNQGVVFAYNENIADSKFGTVSIPIKAPVPISVDTYYCPSCGYNLGQEEKDVSQPDAAQAIEGVPGGQEQCPQCGEIVAPEIESEETTKVQTTGYTETPKNREIISVWGPLNVKVPHWITELSQTPYLELDTEIHYAQVQEIYGDNPVVAKSIQPDYDMYSTDRYARTSLDYGGDIPRDLVTLRRIWLRPWSYNQLGLGVKDADIAALKIAYPDGLYAVIVNRKVLEVVADKMDDHWTATMNPLSSNLHADSIGSTIVPVQDMTNELANLTLETVEFGIPEVFADPQVLDFDAYKLSEARPGMVYPAKAPSGMGLDAGFHEIKTSALSREIEPFAGRLDTTAQFLLGSYPSVYGGALADAGGTAKEYTESKASAMQRLASTWSVLNLFWSDVMEKACKSYHMNMLEDEKYTKNVGSAAFQNVWIRRQEMTGKIGLVEPVSSDQFPITHEAKRNILLGFLGMKNPMIDSVIAHPENASVVADVLGFSDFTIPGDADRQKQLAEISEMILGEPIPMMMGPEMGAMPGQEQFQSSVPIDFDFDDHVIELEICEGWMKSEVGREMKKTNPAAFMNVYFHAKAHKDVRDMLMAQQAAAEAEAAGGEDTPPGEEKESGPPM